MGTYKDSSGRECYQNPFTGERYESSIFGYINPKTGRNLFDTPSTASSNGASSLGKEGFLGLVGIFGFFLTFCPIGSISLNLADRLGYVTPLVVSSGLGVIAFIPAIRAGSAFWIGSAIGLLCVGALCGYGLFHPSSVNPRKGESRSAHSVAHKKASSLGALSNTTPSTPQTAYKPRIDYIVTKTTTTFNGVYLAGTRLHYAYPYLGKFGSAKGVYFLDPQECAKFGIRTCNYAIIPDDSVKPIPP